MRDAGSLGRRAFLAGVAATGTAACAGASGRGRLVLRLSHSMTTGMTSLHLFATAFRSRLEQTTGGDVTLRIFPSGTLGQEREVVQQVQEGLVDFMISGSAIWGSVAPRLQVLDFPFLWRDPAHIHRTLAGPLHDEVSSYLRASARMRPLGWGDSFGFRNVVTRSKHITTPADLVGLKIRTIQSSIYVKTMELMGASPTPMAFGEVYTSMQTGVIDGFEHDASTTLQQRLYEVATVMTRTRHIAGILGLWISTEAESRLPAGLLPIIETAAAGASIEQREAGLKEEAVAIGTLKERGMTVADLDTSTFVTRAEQFWDAEARTLGVAPWLQVIQA